MVLAIFAPNFPEGAEELGYNVMKPHDLLVPKPQGLYCPPGDFFVDPVRPVDDAFVTHSHSDHARPGSRTVFATWQTLDITAIRLGDNFAAGKRALSYGETVSRNGVIVSLQPGGAPQCSSATRIS